MKKSLLVPVDFTPVAYNALTYACELSKIQESEIIAVHLLDEKITSHLQEGGSLAMRKVMERMYKGIMEKTMDDLNNFFSSLKNTYGDIISAVLAHGEIYQAFNEVSARHNCSLIVMGTHGIIGMQHLLGSRAYKVVEQTAMAFLIVHETPYKPINSIYFAFRDVPQLQANAGRIAALSGFFPGKFTFNIISGGNIDASVIPRSLQHVAGRIQVIQNKYKPTDNIADHAQSADAIGICVDIMDNIDDSVYGLKQDRILANKYGLPVLCIPPFSM